MDVNNCYYIQVSRAGSGVARFSFKELCGLPLVKHLHHLRGQTRGCVVLSKGGNPCVTQWYLCVVPL